MYLKLPHDGKIDCPYCAGVSYNSMAAINFHIRKEHPGKEVFTPVYD